MPTKVNVEDKSDLVEASFVAVDMMNFYQPGMSVKDLKKYLEEKTPNVDLRLEAVLLVLVGFQS